MAARLRHIPGGRGAARCGLCGKTENLTRTECCNNWVCDDEDSYVMFSYSRVSCSRNHRRQTLCASHDAEDHDGDWRECVECREGFEPELVAYYGTNEYNFVTLPSPPAFEPKRCTDCNAALDLGLGGYSISPGGVYRCASCANENWEREK